MLIRRGWAIRAYAHARPRRAQHDDVPHFTDLCTYSWPYLVVHVATATLTDASIAARGNIIWSDTGSCFVWREHVDAHLAPSERVKFMSTLISLHQITRPPRTSLQNIKYLLIKRLCTACMRHTRNRSISLSSRARLAKLSRTVFIYVRFE